ncbi:MAG TPA: TonB family protein [Bryobacteraceae bacterium]|nr:TonB family protein [Bryobacteraceae bacterium]
MWSAENHPISIHLDLDVVQRLEELIGPENHPERAVERGGILLGRVRQVNERYIVSVEGVEEVPCEHARGESFTLSRHDLRVFDEALRRNNRRGVVGWFRTHSRPGLFVDQHDFNLLQDHFSHPAAVSLLVRPDRTAGFFLWNEHDMERTRPESTFTLRPEALGLNAKPPGAATPASVPSSRSWFPAPTLLRWTPAVLGLAAGVLWTPAMLRQDDTLVSTPEPVVEQQRSRTAEPPQNVEPPVVGGARPYVPAARTSWERPAVVAARTPAATPSRPVAAVPAAQPSETAERQPPFPRRVTSPAPKPVLKAELETPKPSGVRKAVGSIPGLGFLKRKGIEDAQSFTGPRAVREVRPSQVQGFSDEVRVKVRIDEDGYVRAASLVDRNVPGGIAQSAVDAARRWRFEPARRDRKAVQSEMLITFRPTSRDGG